MSDINNGARRAIEYLVYGALPPHSTKVLWMDTSVPELPVLKIFWNGCWTPVHTDVSKEVEMLVEVISELTATNASQQETIDTLSNSIDETTKATEEIAEKMDEEKLSAFTLANALLNDGEDINLITIKHRVPHGPDHSLIPQNAPALKTGRKYTILMSDETYHTRIEWVIENTVFVYTEGTEVDDPVYLNKEDESGDPTYGYSIGSASSFHISNSNDLAELLTAIKGNNDEATNTAIARSIDYYGGNIEQYLVDSIAKQGTDSTASLTGVNDKIDRFYDTFDADIALQLQNIIGGDEEIEDNSQTEEQVQELRTLQQSISDLAASVTALKDSHVINNISVESIVFEDGYIPESGADVLYDTEKIIEINDDTTETVSIVPPLPFCKKIRMSALKRIYGFYNGYGRETLYSMPECIEADFPELIEVTCGNYYNILSRSTKLRTLKVPKMKAFPFIRETGNTVMDVWIGAEFDSNVNMQSWGCSTADGKNLSTTSTNLLTDEDLAAGFTSNAEKCLWNVRNHIAAFLPDLTGETSHTITFDSYMKAAIQADTATSDAFTNKNWTIV